MVLPREVLRKTSIQVPTQEALDCNIINSQDFPLFKNVNVHKKEIIPKAMRNGAFLVYYGFNTDLGSITIYKRVKTLYHQDEPSTQALLTFLWGCMTIRLVRDKRSFVPSSVFMESNPPTALTWGLKKFNTNFPNLFTPHQQPYLAADTSSPNINLKLFQHFLSVLKLPGLSPAPAITTGPTEPIVE